MSLQTWLSERHRARLAAGLDRAVRPRGPTSGLLDLAGNDYLGLAAHPSVTAAAAEATLAWGAGAGSSRLVSGTLELHCRLEAALAEFTECEAALVFATGYQANLGAVSALTDQDTLLVSDAHVHASLVDACRLARPGGVTITPHNDLAAVETALRERTLTRAMVIVESVYSVLGDAAPLTGIAELCEAYDAILLVDEAHGIGVAGKDGHGLVAAHGLAGRPGVVTTLTLSKALGSQGGAVVGPAAVVQHLVNTARTFIYDTALAPSATAAALAALEVIAAEPGLPYRVLEVADLLASAVGQPAPAGAVLSLGMPGPQEALAAQAGLVEAGIRVGCFRPPSVPDEVSRLRLTARADLTEADLDRVTGQLALVLAGAR